jgi:hypothetical protein
LDVQSALLEVVTILKDGLTDSLKGANKVASGKTIDSIEAVSTDHDAQLLASPYIYALQDGRKPTSPNAAKGDPTLFELIKEWCVEKGIDPKLAYPITKHIHEFGYPGIEGVIDEPLSEENVDKAMQKALGDIGDLFTNAIADKLVLA